MGILARAWGAIRPGRRQATSADLFRRAERCRRAGQLEEAAVLVYQGLALDPRSVLGHLLAGYVHAAFRRGEAARMEFRAALAIDPDHPRALLGLARIALEEGDAAGCLDGLRRALAVYPDFPEARALIEAVGGPGAPRVEGPAAAPRGFERLPLPVGSRECVVGRPDGSVIFSHPGRAATEVLGPHLVRLSRIASATLARAGLSAMETAVVEASAGTTFVRSDARMILALTLPREVPIGVGQRQAEGLFTRCLDQLGLPS